MKAVGYRSSLPIDHPESLVDLEVNNPMPREHDLLVEIQAISVNPVDTKIRRNVAPAAGEVKILGWDAAGIVRAVGAKVSLFKPGDRVWYAGDLTRPGTNSEYHLVDERIVGRMPQSLDFERAAALPLTTITAWELLFDRLQIQEDSARNESLLIVGAAGGVGSILTQLARQLTSLTIIGSGSRPQTQEWIKALGAHHVVDHSKPLAEEIQRIGHPEVDYVASLTQTQQHLPQLVEALRPQGKLGLIDDPETFDIRLLKRKSISLHWEFMYTRSLFQTADMIEQHHLLNRVADLVDAGRIKTTFAEHFGTINAANLKRAHALLESGTARGKIVLAGF